MSPLPVAVIALLVIVIGVYLATRAPPPAWSPSTACGADSDCPHPKTCSTATGKCVDLALPGLITNAQNAAQKFYSEVQAVFGNFQGVYAAHAKTVVQIGTTIGTSSPDMKPFTTNLASGIDDIYKYIRQVLAVPGCRPASSTSCGYLAEVLALTPDSPAATIWSVGSQASSVAIELPTATQAFLPVATELVNIIDSIVADAIAKNIAASAALNPNPVWALLHASPTQILSYQTLPGAIRAVQNDVAQIKGYESSLTALAAAVKQTGDALYSHFISV